MFTTIYTITDKNGNKENYENIRTALVNANYRNALAATAVYDAFLTKKEQGYEITKKDAAEIIEAMKEAYATYTIARRVVDIDAEGITFHGKIEAISTQEDRAWRAQETASSIEFTLVTILNTPDNDPDDNKDDEPEEETEEQSLKRKAYEKGLITEAEYNGDVTTFNLNEERWLQAQKLIAEQEPIDAKKDGNYLVIRESTGTIFDWEDSEKTADLLRRMHTEAFHGETFYIVRYIHGYSGSRALKEYEQETKRAQEQPAQPEAPQVIDLTDEEAKELDGIHFDRIVRQVRERADAHKINRGGWIVYDKRSDRYWVFTTKREAQRNLGDLMRHLYGDEYTSKYKWHTMGIARVIDIIEDQRYMTVTDAEQAEFDANKKALEAELKTEIDAKDHIKPGETIYRIATLNTMGIHKGCMFSQNYYSKESAEEALWLYFCTAWEKSTRNKAYDKAREGIIEYTK